MEYNKGDIVLVNFNPTKGAEIGKLRPAIVMSQKEDNNILDTVIVIPLSTVIEPNAEPYRLHISLRDKLEKNSDACVYEIRALSKTRIKEKLAKLTSIELAQVQKNLCLIVGTTGNSL